MEIISRKEAKALGMKRYYTGKVCKRGHNSEKFVTSRVCCICQEEKDKNRKKYHKNKQEIVRKMNPHYSQQMADAYYNKNIDKRKKYKSDYRENNKEKISLADKNYQEKNKEKISKIKKEKRIKDKLAKQEKQTT